MRRWMIPSAIVAGLACTVVTAQPPRRDVDNAAAFARLYGVVRYFYPGDAAANLAWNRFAVHGVKLARSARDAGELEKVLSSLFAPLGPGIAIARVLPAPPPTGIPDRTLITWRYAGAAMDPQTAAPMGPYRGKRTNRGLVLAPTLAGVTMAQTVPAAPLRGRTIKLRGLVRVTTGGSGPGAVLWLRVDRANQQQGFFDNMMDRPARDSTWREYTIEGPVADDATNIAFGTIVIGAVSADFDGLTLSVKEANGEWTPVAIEDGGFEGDAAARGWTRGGNTAAADVSRLAEQAPEGKQFLRFAAKEAPTEAFEGDPLALGAHVDIDLGLGLKARVRLALTDAEAKASNAATMQVLTSALESAGEPADEPDLDARLADVVVAWNVFRHFYPYWAEAAVDWDARLRPHLETASAAKGRDGQREALRRLVADVRDGHGGVNDVRRRRVQASLPVALEVREKRIVVVATNAPEQAPIGAVVTAIGDVPADRRLSELMALHSGTPQWRERRALGELTSCQPGATATVTLALQTDSGARSGSLTCEARPAPVEKRPAPVGELESGVWYVDLSRARMNQITPELPKLAEAKGVVFDLRGYPTDAGAGILPFLLAAPETDRWMHVAHFSGPFGKVAGWRDLGWDVRPQSPRVQGRVVFLTDGRAISYAESVMGYIGDRKLATIVGGTTAGANGNVATFPTPSGYSISFTGMKVTRHDGKSPFHLAGVAPDIPISPTIEGLRAGRDEVLERGVAVILGK
jgi:hypothetical protein